MTTQFDRNAFCVFRAQRTCRVAALSFLTRCMRS